MTTSEAAVERNTLSEVMIDIETMGINSYAPVVAIGAVRYDPYAKVGDFQDYFYKTIDLQSALDAGAKVDGGTVAFWMRQSKEAQQAIFGTEDEPNLGTPILTALNEFTIWFGPKSLRTWGNGAAFDCVILRNAYRLHDIYPPFKFRDEMCYRTLRAVLPAMDWEEPEIEHHALYDAKAQARYHQRMTQYLNQA